MLELVFTLTHTHIRYLQIVSALVFAVILFSACQDTNDLVSEENKVENYVSVSTPIKIIETLEESNNSKSNLDEVVHNENVSRKYQLVEGDVVGVPNGEQIEVDIDGRIVVVSYEGINIPGNEQMISQGAKDLNKFLVNGSRVIIEYDPLDNDEPHKKISGYVYVSGELVNSRLIGSGFAIVDSTIDFRMREYFEKLQKEAMNQKLGVWDRDIGTICGTLPC